MIAAAYKPVYDNLAQSGRQKQSMRICDVCDREGYSYEFYLFPGDSERRLDCCTTCRASKQLEAILTPIDRTDKTEEEKPRIWKCDMCATKLGGGCKWFANVEKDLDVCETCYGHSDTLFDTLRSSPNICETERGLVLKLTDPASIDYNYPDIFPLRLLAQNDRLTAICEKWAEEWRHFVRVPKNFVWTEWVRFMPWDKSQSTNAHTSLAVRCVHGQDHHFASLLKDNRGRISIDIVQFTSPFNDVFFYHGNARFDSPDKTCASFSEFVRLENKLPFYL